MSHGSEQAANVVLVLGLVAPFIALGAFLILRQLPGTSKLVRAILIGAPALVFIVANPLGQLLFLGPVDVGIRKNMCERAEKEGLVGKPPDAVTALFGEPCEKRYAHPGIVGPAQPLVYVSPAYDAWDYAPLPVFFAAHANHFKVFFQNGVVWKVKCAM